MTRRRTGTGIAASPDGLAFGRALPAEPGDGTMAEAEATLRGIDTGRDVLTGGAALYSGNRASCHQPSGASTTGQGFPVLSAFLPVRKSRK